MSKSENTVTLENKKTSKQYKVTPEAAENIRKNPHLNDTYKTVKETQVPAEVKALQDKKPADPKDEGKDKGSDKGATTQA